MKRNVLLITAVLFWFASFATAAEQKKESAPQSQQGQQAEMVCNDAHARIDGDAFAKNDRAPRTDKTSKPKSMQDDPEGDPHASQNQVEYGGAG